jgi:hypothetical protein
MEIHGTHPNIWRFPLRILITRFPHTGLQVQSNFDPFTPIVEGDQITLTCRSKNKDVMDLAWRWLPTVPLPYQTITFMEINTTRLPAGLNS